MKYYLGWASFWIVSADIAALGNLWLVVINSALFCLMSCTLAILEAIDALKEQRIEPAKPPAGGAAYGSPGNPIIENEL